MAFTQRLCIQLWFRRHLNNQPNCLFRVPRSGQELPTKHVWQACDRCNDTVLETTWDKISLPRPICIHIEGLSTFPSQPYCLRIYTNSTTSTITLYCPTTTVQADKLHWKLICEKKEREGKACESQVLFATVMEREESNNTVSLTRP